MSLEIHVLHALRERRKFQHLRGAVPDSMISPDTVVVLAWFKAYFDSFPECDTIETSTLREFVKLRSPPDQPERVAITLHLIEKLNEPADPAAIAGMLGVLREMDLSGKAAALISRYQSGEEVDLVWELQQLTNAAAREGAGTGLTAHIDTPISELLKEIEGGEGLVFRRLAVLREHIQPLQPGALVAIAARVDAGKGSFIASTITDWAPQVLELYGPERPIVVLSNEGAGKRFIPRIYQAALGVDYSELIKLSNSGVLSKMYADKVGDPSIIRVKDIHGWGLPQIQEYVQHVQPSVVVVDMVANVRSAKQSSSKTDDLEAVWQGLREMAVINSFVCLGTSQISYEGANNLYPPMSALKDSKTGVQGTFDVAINMGSLDAPEMQNLRGIGIVKNKFAVAGMPAYARAEVWFDGGKCTFTDGSGT